MAQQFAPRKSSSLGNEDYQKNRVYRWEDTRLGHLTHVLEEHETDALIASVCRDLNVPCPSIQHRFFKRRHADATETALRFGTESYNARRPYIILHELAHYLNKKNDHHGPYFVRVYHHVLLRFLPLEHVQQIKDFEFSLGGLQDSVAEFGIAVAHTLHLGVRRADADIPSAEEL